MAASTSLCPFSGSFTSHLSFTQAIAPVSFFGSPALATPPLRMNSAADRPTNNCLGFIGCSLEQAMARRHR